MLHEPVLPQLRLPLVVVIEDDPVARAYLVRLAERSGIECRPHASAEAFLAEYDQSRPTCIFLDLSLPGMDGVECLKRVLAFDPVPSVVIVTGTADVTNAVRLLRLGALHLLEKPVAEAEVGSILAAAIEQARQRHGEALTRRRVCARVASLSPREREVFERVVRGAMNKQIAAELGIAAKTVEVHRANVMRKLDVGSLAQLVRLAVDAGIGLDSGSAAAERDPSAGSGGSASAAI